MIILMKYLCIESKRTQSILKFKIKLSIKLGLQQTKTRTNLSPQIRFQILRQWNLNGTGRKWSRGVVLEMLSIRVTKNRSLIPIFLKGLHLLKPNVKVFMIPQQGSIYLIFKSYQSLQHSQRVIPNLKQQKCKHHRRIKIKKYSFLRKLFHSKLDQ